MKLKIDWANARELGLSALKAAWAAAKPILAGAIGAGIISLSSGCSTQTQTTRTPRMGAYAFGFPAFAWVEGGSQTVTFEGGDTNGLNQATSQPVSVPVDIK